MMLRYFMRSGSLSRICLVRLESTLVLRTMEQVRFFLLEEEDFAVFPIFFYFSILSIISHYIHHFVYL